MPPVLSFFLGLLFFATGLSAAERPPNVVFILADDLGWFDLACYGRKDHRTPNLDKLALEGARFTSAYCAQPICSPSRAAIMTGKHPARVRITTYIPGRNDNAAQKLLHPAMNQRLPLEERTLAEAFKERGYATALVGKWHLGGKGFLPTDQGFDFYYAGSANTKPDLNEGSKGEMDLTARSIAFMQTNRSRPFFLFLGHNSPHIVFSETPERVQKNNDAFNPVYAAVIERLDESVGKLLGAVDELGLSDNTLVIFTSDNGGLHVPEGSHERVTHNGPLRAGKGYVYEGGNRIPLIVRWPGKIARGRVIEAPTVNTDWFSTLVDIAGIAPPPSDDRMSQAGLLLGKAEAAPRTFFWHFPHYNNQGGVPTGAARDGKWKYVEYYDRPRAELYDLSSDLGEQTNLAASNASLVKQFSARLADFRASVRAQTNTVNENVDLPLYRSLYETIDTSAHRSQTATPMEEQRVKEWRERMNMAARAGLSR